MTGFKTIIAAALISTLPISGAFAQLSEPAAYQAQHPDRDVLNGGQLTPAARAGLERPFGGAGAATANDAYGMEIAAPAPHARHRGHRHPVQ
jgi:hypothetical protein